jgi:3,5-epimerase/4-reductase
MYNDSRGYLIFPIKNEKYMNGSKNISKDCTYSVNKKNVFRGLHINTFGKLITCISGKFIDIMVNMETLEVKYYNIKPGDQIYCPGNYGHGFLSLEENSVLSYHCEGYFGNEEGGLLNYKDVLLNIKLPVEDSEIIINEKDSKAPFLEFDYFILGSKGYIGSHIYNNFRNSGKKILALQLRMENIKGIKNLLQFYKPKYFINAAGLTGVPNIDWCNSNQRETLMTNVINQINILNLCNEYNVHCTIIGSGAIFKTSLFNNLNIKYSISNGDLCDNNNYYSKCRILLEDQMKPFKNYLYLRVNYPFSDNIENEKNLLHKLLFKYSHIENVSLSVTNLNSLIPILRVMIENEEIGIYNFVNKNKINMYDLYLWANDKYSKNNTKKTLVDTKRESIELVPDKLENYSIDDIYESLTTL